MLFCLHSQNSYAQAQKGRARVCRTLDQRTRSQKPTEHSDGYDIGRADLRHAPELLLLDSRKQMLSEIQPSAETLVA